MTEMKCPVCFSDLVQDTRNLVINYKNRRGVLSDISGIYCTCCDEIVFNDEDEHYHYTTSIREFKSKQTTYYIVWNKDKTEGFVTTDNSLAYEVRKGSEGNCYSEEDGVSLVAMKFCEVWGDEDCTIEKVN